MQRKIRIRDVVYIRHSRQILRVIEHDLIVVGVDKFHYQMPK